MQNQIGPQTPYEVYCYECHVTFPVGTSRCIHCGRPIGAPAAGRGIFELAGMPGVPGTPGAPGLPGAEDASPREGADPTMLARRLGGAGLWVLIALGAALTRYCGGG